MNAADITSNMTSSQLAIDSKNLSSLKNAAKDNSPEALKQVAKQFEAMLMNMMLKSMREASPQDGMFDNEQTQMFTSMLDQQLSQTMSDKGTGLADMLVKQLSKNLNAPPVVEADKSSQAQTAMAPRSAMFSQTFPYQAQTVSPMANVEVQKTTNTKPINVASNFEQRLKQAAQSASEASGIPAEFMLAQAALESGWGKREIKTADGQTSYNLFGIKATGQWDGKVAETMTTEYINGEKQKRVEKFRAYDSYEAAFHDYAKLISTNPRYQKAMQSTDDAAAYAKALQQGGYATDPNYANKLISVMKRIDQS